MGRRSSGTRATLKLAAEEGQKFRKFGLNRLLCAAVKGIPRPTVTELSGGQNKVLHYAEQFACNKTPTWCKAPEDKATNYVGGALCATSFFMLVSISRKHIPQFVLRKVQHAEAGATRSWPYFGSVGRSSIGEELRSRYREAWREKLGRGLSHSCWAKQPHTVW